MGRAALFKYFLKSLEPCEFTLKLPKSVLLSLWCKRGGGYAALLFSLPSPPYDTPYGTINVLMILRNLKDWGLRLRHRAWGRETQQPTTN